ncbi:methyltransferase family protein [Sphingosinicella terrae]|uniref:methyltransferase family protein n=1 Tax=Sphingosinicella terrae TaxID=2172047 RepID=UPI000E0DEC9F|nr:isoprenylcysteine carboxylmethyltransferase family protein [Sphingosinicella terrae]
MTVEAKPGDAPHTDPRPASAVSAATGLVGLGGLVLWTLVARHFGMIGPLAALTALVACAVPMLLWSILVDKVHRRPTTGIDWDAAPRPLRETIDISLVKLAGLWGIWGVIGALYCIARWYWDGAYLFAMQVIGVAAIPMVLLSFPYLLWLDRRLAEPRDGAWHFGQWLIGRPEAADREILYDFLRAWAVKGFFLAFMISIVPGNWAETIRLEWAWIADNPANLARWLIAVMFMIDVVFATVGYALTLKPLDAHIRSANPYTAGWVAALICYPPFILMNPGGPLDYHIGAEDWTWWLADHPWLMTLNAVWLVFLTGVYAWATVAFGIRFSNLTHRGILTNGPYAWSKHPAYLSKNLFWWFAALPFLASTGNPVDMVRNTVVLALIGGVYYWRARTEERHLMADPAYREYAEWMERNGPIPRLINALSGRPSRDRPGPPRPAAAE